MLSRFATSGEIWPMPMFAPCGGMVGRAPPGPGTALLARRIAEGLAMMDHQPLGQLLELSAATAAGEHSHRA